MAIEIQGQVAPCNNWTDDSAYLELIRDYNCGYFYDDENESLHQVKIEYLLCEHVVQGWTYFSVQIVSWSLTPQGWELFQLLSNTYE